MAGALLLAGACTKATIRLAKAEHQVRPYVSFRVLGWAAASCSLHAQAAVARVSTPLHDDTL